ncbi:hypothetical protein DKL61_09290 [Gammaproteobacteria bacterium ESL0073]|nr:hypothetical protein DKL61_09290 [Gammaproteobacteria bacterium ESL0073]
MPNKSISFNEEMLKAILDGRKTQTRRPHAETKYQVGDIVYVKEPWKIKQWYQDDGDLDIEYVVDGTVKHKSVPYEEDDSGEIFNEYWIESCDDYIEASVPFNEENERYETPEINPCRLRPAEEMPEYFSRIQLKITSVRKEKLQDITEQDAIAEGFNTRAAFISPLGKPFALHWFENIWQSIYRKDKSKSWEANPYVWVYEFERL